MIIWSSIGRLLKHEKTWFTGASSVSQEAPTLVAVDGKVDILLK